MKILVCRVAWMPRYQSRYEKGKGGGSYVTEKTEPHEALNFLPVGGTYYGFVENGGKKITLERLGGRAADKTIGGVSIVFCAERPKSREFLVTGWYSGATVHRCPVKRPEDPLQRDAYFTATDATLIGDTERCFRIPRARDWPRSGFGGIGQSQIWYGLNDERASTFRKSLIDYMATRTLRQTSEEAVVESRKRRISERLEREGAHRHFIRTKGYQCEACKRSIEEDEQDVWGSSFELHHLTPFSELAEDESQEVRIEDFAVLCASCHRAIHRTDYVSDVEGFATTYVRS